MELNYYLMQMMNMNPFLFQMNNNQRQNFMFQKPSNFNNNNIVEGGVLPRPNQVTNLMDNQDLFPGIPGPRLNIIFETSTGIIKNITTPLQVTVKDLLTKYAQKVGINEKLVWDKIFFVINGLVIKEEDQYQTVQQYFQSGNNQIQYKIVVLDKSNIIGA